MKVIGITGTKGKTTTTHMIKSVLEKAGYTVEDIKSFEDLKKVAEEFDAIISDLDNELKETMKGEDEDA